MKKAKIFALAMALCILFGNITVLAAGSPTILRWSNIVSVKCEVTFNGTSGTVCGKVVGQTGASQVRGTLTLYEGNTEKVTWDMAADIGAKTVLDTFTGTSGVTYKLTLDAEVYKNGTWEPVSVEDSGKCP